MNNWISVKERLPEDDKFYLCAKDIGVLVFCCSYSQNIKAWLPYPYPRPEEGITHWMELPEPPKDNKA